MAEDVIEINQEWARGIGVQIRLLNGRELRVEKKEKRNNIKYTIDLLALEDVSKQKVIFGWKWFIAGIVSILLMLLCIKFLPVLGESALFSGVVYFLGIGAAVGCFFMAWKGTSRKQIFHTRNASVPIVELAINKPSKSDFSKFIAKVERCIKDSRAGKKISTNNQLAGEMKMLRRLSEDGVVSIPVYKKARSGLLGKHSQ